MLQSSERGEVWLSEETFANRPASSPRLPLGRSSLQRTGVPRCRGTASTSGWSRLSFQPICLPQQ